MNSNPYVVDDDDVVLVDTEVIDVDKNSAQNKKSENNQTTVDKSLPGTSNSGLLPANDKNSSFARLLKNNTLMNKVVKYCLKMKNNIGMSRVVHKSLQPLYADADNNFKESEQFSNLLKTILRNLKLDPDHKFLHIKTLCEELKAGRHGRKVPFITLSTQVKKKPKKVKETFKRSNLKKRRNISVRKARTIYNKTAVIELDTEDVPMINLDGDDNDIVVDSDDSDVVVDSDDSDVVVNNNDDSCLNHVVVDSDSDCQVDIIEKDEHDITDSGNSIKSHDNTNKCDITNSVKNVSRNNTHARDITNSGKNSHSHDNTNELSITDSGKKSHGHDNTNVESTGENDEVTIVDMNSDISIELSNKQNSVKDSMNKEKYLTNCMAPKKNNRLQNVHSDEDQVNSNEIPGAMDYELLIPKNTKNTDYAKADALEKLITFYKGRIDELESEEVTDGPMSAYILCNKYKTKMVQLYRKLCRLTGNGDGNLMKNRVVRLQVIKGHPAGPTRKLERFLNSTIDETGNVPLPDFYDVMKCVSEANIEDELRWSRQEKMREALALFSQCGHALRKNRQKREYKDLMGLAKDIMKDPHDNDPADNDPLLLAKLEENKRIAKANEDEVFERFVRMERPSMPPEAINSRMVNTLSINQEDSDTDAEPDLPPPKKSKLSSVSDEETKGKSNEPDPVDNRSSIIIAKQSEIGTSQDNPINNPNINTAIERLLNAFNTAKQNENIASQNNTDNTIKQNKLLAITRNHIVTSTVSATASNLNKKLNITRYTPSNTIVEKNTINNPSNNTTSHLVNTGCNIDNTTPKNTVNDLERNGSGITTNITDKTANFNNNPNQIRPLYLTINPLLPRTKTNNTQYTQNINNIRKDQEFTEVNSEVTQSNIETSESKDGVKVEVKTEPEDVCALLDALGDNYTATIFDIEDPFLVIEISDTSSDDEL